MTKLLQLAKEETVKSLIDKIIFGVIAALIVFNVQKHSDQNTRRQIEKEAIFEAGKLFCPE